VARVDGLGVAPDGEVCAPGETPLGKATHRRRGGRISGFGLRVPGFGFLFSVFWFLVSGSGSGGTPWLASTASV